MKESKKKKKTTWGRQVKGLCVRHHRTNYFKSAITAQYWLIGSVKQWQMGSSCQLWRSIELKARLRCFVKVRSVSVLGPLIIYFEMWQHLQHLNEAMKPPHFGFLFFKGAEESRKSSVGDPITQPLSAQQRHLSNDGNSCQKASEFSLRSSRTCSSTLLKSVKICN